MNNFADGDRVFLFGFSRGAYTVRALTSLLYMYGLIPAGNEPFVPYAIRMLMAVQHDSEARVRTLAEQFRDTFSTRDCRPYFVGVQCEQPAGSDWQARHCPGRAPRLLSRQSMAPAAADAGTARTRRAAGSQAGVVSGCAL